MSVDHSDPNIQKLFDVEVAAHRAGVDGTGPPTSITCEADLDYINGYRLAAKRSPGPLNELAARFTTNIDEQGHMRVDPPDLDPSTVDPVLVERAGLIAYLDARARARAAAATTVPRS